MGGGVQDDQQDLLEALCAGHDRDGQLGMRFGKGFGCMMDKTDLRGKGAAVKAMGVADPGEGRVPLKGGYEEALSSTVRVTGEKKTVAEVFINMDRYNGKRVRELI